MNNNGLELKKLGRMKAQMQRKLRELERIEASPSVTPAGRIEHLQTQVKDLETRINGR